MRLNNKMISLSKNTDPIFEFLRVNMNGNHAIVIVVFSTQFFDDQIKFDFFLREV